jgi:hypothetical protein
MMKRRRILAVCVIVWSATSLLVGKQTASPPETDPLARQTLLRLDNAHLTAAQVAQIRVLVAKCGPDIRRAERKAGLTAAQGRARQEAMARAVAQHLGGAQARDLLTNAATRSDEQKAAMALASRLRQQFDQAVSGLLTEAQRSKRWERPTPEQAGNGFIIVQLSPDLPLPPESAKTLEDVAVALKLPNLRRVIVKQRLAEVSQRAIRSDLLDRLEDLNNPAASAEIRLLRSFWQIDTRAFGPRSIDDIVKRLNELPEVKEAYAALRLTECSTGCVNPCRNPYYPLQGYLGPAPMGIDAPAAWSLCGGQGAGVSLADLESSWNIDHEDLKALLRSPVYGDNQPHNQHGTSVVGEIMGQDNTVGIIGAAPQIDSVTLTSLYDAATGDMEAHIGNALAAALFFLSPGDVFLIEEETDTGYPVEIQTLEFDAIRLAISRGLVVVEPTGNGKRDLDAFLHHGQPILNRYSSSFRESGAIVVGASDPARGHVKANGSDFGSRVDCFSWGNDVVTTSKSGVADIIGSPGADDDKSYRSRFNGTSSAAPIVAGAALLVQGLWKQRCGVGLSSTEMRDILSNPCTGTPQGAGVPGFIGVMPDLSAILAAYGFDDCSLFPSRGVGTGFLMGTCQGGYRRCTTQKVLRSFPVRHR